MPKQRRKIKDKRVRLPSGGGRETRSYGGKDHPSDTHPTMARYPEHALVVNVKKTLKNVGMSIRFPFEKHPEGIGMLLID